MYQPVFSLYPVKATVNVSPTWRKAEGRRLNFNIRLVCPANMSDCWKVVSSISDN